MDTQIHSTNLWIMVGMDFIQVRKDLVALLRKSRQDKLTQ